MFEDKKEDEQIETSVRKHRDYTQIAAYDCEIELQLAGAKAQAAS